MRICDNDHYQQCLTIVYLGMNIDVIAGASGIIIFAKIGKCLLKVLWSAMSKLNQCQENMFLTWWQIHQTQRQGMKSARFAANPKMNTIQKKSRIVPWNWLRRDWKDTVICAVWPSLKVASMTDAENVVNGILWQVIRWAIKENSSG